ncbi:MAG TPA: hypothetical protein VHX17_05210 [Candidatus Cybelea sp.]|jgi:hypothetical protein|nr:hypothetical protein [Candidatus Cybelea sp.]
MSRLPALALAALMGLLLARCGVGQSGISLPRSGDGVQTVSDAADSLVAHRSSGSENAKAAIGVTDAFGSVLREINDDERFLSGFGAATKTDFARTSTRVTPGAKRVLSVAALVMRPSFGNVSAYCQSSAGYTAKGIPSLDTTFGWQTGTFSGGTRSADGARFATWSANATGKSVQAPVGGLSIVRSGDAVCPMMTPAYTIAGAAATNTFSIPLTVTYRSGSLWNLTISNASFSNGENLDAATVPARQPEIAGVITKGNVELASFRANARGKGTLTITSTGAQYVITDWIVVGT